jgi:hypothetical protein
VPPEVGGGGQSGGGDGALRTITLPTRAPHDPKRCRSQRLVRRPGRQGATRGRKRGERLHGSDSSLSTRRRAASFKSGDVSPSPKLPAICKSPIISACAGRLDAGGGQSRLQAGGPRGGPKMFQSPCIVGRSCGCSALGQPRFETELLLDRFIDVS